MGRKAAVTQRPSYYTPADRRGFIRCQHRNELGQLDCIKVTSHYSDRCNDHRLRKCEHTGCHEKIDKSGGKKFCRSHNAHTPSDASRCYGLEQYE